MTRICWTRSKIRSPLSPLPQAFAFCISPRILSLVTTPNSAMDTVKEAMKALKQVVPKGEQEKELTEKVDSLTTTLLLLVITFERNRQQRHFTNLNA